MSLQHLVALRDLHLAGNVAQARADDVAVANDGCAAVDCDVDLAERVGPGIEMYL